MAGPGDDSRNFVRFGSIILDGVSGGSYSSPISHDPHNASRSHHLHKLVTKSALNCNSTNERT